MSVLMTLRLRGDAAKLEEMAKDKDVMRNIVDRAKTHGLISHHFYGNDEEIMVVDEWPTAENFHAFFDEAQDDIRANLGSVADMEQGPQITFWRKLSVGDEVG